jgi:hypothetical protein
MSSNYFHVKTANNPIILSEYTAGKLTSESLHSTSSGTFESAASENQLGTAMFRCLELIEIYRADNRIRSGEFDNAIGKLLHEEAGISNDWARDNRFWIWLTFAFDGLGAFIIDSRLGKSDSPRGSAAPHHYGFGPVRKSYFAKCWLHSDISYDVFSDYRMLTLHDVDFWDSHIMGPDYGFSREISAAFYELVTTENIPRGEPRGANIGFRQLSKELTRRNATTCYELMTFDEAKNFVKTVWNAKSSWTIENE